VKPDLNCNTIIQILRNEIPDLLAIYAFDSQIQETAWPGK